MARVTGVGGVFLRSADPKALGAWYAKHLGIEVGAYGATFMWKDEVPKGTGMTAWNPFPMDTTYFGEGNQAVMINYRVDDLDVLLVGLAMLNGLADLAEQHSLLLAVDDAHWLDQPSAQTLSFVARRLQAEGVGLVFAVRESIA